MAHPAAPRPMSPLPYTAGAPSLAGETTAYSGSPQPQCRPTATGLQRENVQYPDYFALQLASKFIQAGGTVVSATEDNETSVDTYAILEPNGHLALLVINKAKSTLGTPPSNLPAPTLTEQFTINGFTPSGRRLFL